MTKQEIYETVRAWFTREDAAPSYNKDRHVCMYRATVALPDGRFVETACAIGCLIPPATYSTVLENKTIMADEVQVALSPVLGNIDEELERFLSELQQAHDEVASQEQLSNESKLKLIVRNLDRVAVEYNLLEVERKTALLESVAVGDAARDKLKSRGINA